MNKVFVLPIILGALVSTVIILLVFSVSTISIQIKNADCLDANIQNQLPLKGKNIFFLNITPIKESLEKKYPCIQNVYVTKQYPKSIVVTIEGKKGVLAFTQKTDDVIASSSGGLQNQFFIASDNEVIFKSMESSPSGMPTVFYSGTKDLKVGENLGILVSNTYTITQKLKEFQIPVQELNIQDDSLEVKSDNPKVIIFNATDDVSRELASLQLILQAGKMNSDLPFMDRVDLRFEKPIINYSPKK